VNADEYFRRYQQKRTADEELRENMRHKVALFRHEYRIASGVGPLRTPFNCIEVGALLLLTGVCCTIAFFTVAGIFSGLLFTFFWIPNWAALIVYSIPFCLCVAVYAAVLRHSTWFFRLQRVFRWAASVVSAIALTGLLLVALNLLVGFLV
jgi:hypothetical protein